MTVQGISREALEHIAKQRGIVLLNLSSRWIKSRRVKVQDGGKLRSAMIEQHSFVLRPEYGSDRYRAYSLRQGTRYEEGDLFEPERKVRFLKPRRKGAVCWHGHRDFMRDVFKRNPLAVIKTCMARYQGAHDFEASHERTRSGNTGPHGYGIVSGFDIEYADSCPCEGNWDGLAVNA